MDAAARRGVISGVQRLVLTDRLLDDLLPQSATDDATSELNRLRAIFGEDFATRETTFDERCEGIFAVFSVVVRGPASAAELQCQLLEQYPDLPARISVKSSKDLATGDVLVLQRMLEQKLCSEPRPTLFNVFRAAADCLQAAPAARAPAEPSIHYLPPPNRFGVLTRVHSTSQLCKYTLQELEAVMLKVKLPVSFLFFLTSWLV